MREAVNYSIIGITFIALCISAYTDIKMRKIPLWLFPSVFVLAVGARLFTGQTISWDLIGMGIVFLGTMVTTLFGMGGGDVIMLSTIAFVIGAGNLILFILSLSITVLIYSIIRKVKKKEKIQIPLAPFCIPSFLLVIILEAFQ